jgi:prevent-host-death family protein
VGPDWLENEPRDTSREAVELAREDDVDHDDHMRRTSLVHAKAHLSELVDQAEHKGKPVLILRHGKPAAAIVPVSMIKSVESNSPLPIKTDQELDTYWAGFGRGDSKGSAIEDLVRGRRPWGER